MFALSDSLGVGDKRGKELSAELHGLIHTPEFTMELVCQTIAKDHDPDSVLIGAFLGMAILMNNNRVVPQGYQIVEGAVSVHPIPGYEEPD